MHNVNVNVISIGILKFNVILDMNANFNEHSSPEHIKQWKDYKCSVFKSQCAIFVRNFPFRSNVFVTIQNWMNLFGERIAFGFVGPNLLHKHMRHSMP